MPEAARLHDEISHSQEGLFMKIGAAVGAVVGAVMVGAEVVAEVGALFTGALTLPAVVGLGATLVTAGVQVAGTTSFGMFIGKTLGSYFHHKAGEIISAASTVFIGGQPAARGEADVGKCDDHEGTEVSKSVPVQTGRRIAEGSETVFIETFHAARKGDKGTCLYRISGGCDSVVIGGAKVQLLDIAASETPTLDKVMLVLGVVSGVGALRQAFGKSAVAGLAALLKMTGIVGASLGAGEVAKRWAGGKWGEGSEEQERATLTAQLGAGILAERFASSKSGSAMIDAAATRIAAEGAATRSAMADFAAKMRGSSNESSAPEQLLLPGPRQPTAQEQVEALTGHGHDRHGSQTTLAEQETRLRTGVAPDGLTAKTSRATKFDSPEAELDAVTRAQAQTAARVSNGDVSNAIVVDSNGVARLPPREAPIVTGFPGGYGSGLEAPTNPATGKPYPLPDRTPLTMNPTGQDPNALVVLQYDPLTGTWQPVTHYPTNQPVSP